MAPHSPLLWRPDRHVCQGRAWLFNREFTKSSWRGSWPRLRISDGGWEIVRIISQQGSRLGALTSPHHDIAMNPASTMGTIISETHLQRIEKMVAERPTKAKILAGGKRLTGASTLDEFDFSQGIFYPPTVIEGVETHDELWREEVFGPVVVVKKFTVSQLLPLFPWDATDR